MLSASISENAPVSNDDSLSSLERKVELRLTIDLKFLAHELEKRFNDLLEPPPPGIYSHLAVDPVMVSGEKYYTRHKRDELKEDFLGDHRAKMMTLETADWNGPILVQITDINTVNRAVYTRDGKCIIPASTMKHRARNLSNYPILPYRGIKIAHLLYRWRLDECLRYPRLRVDAISRIQEHFLPGAYENEDLEVLLHPFYMEVGEHTVDLTCHHEWKLFHTELHGTTLTIERGIDWRILAWVRQQEEAEERRQETEGVDRRRSK